MRQKSHTFLTPKGKSTDGWERTVLTIWAIHVWKTGSWLYWHLSRCHIWSRLLRVYKHWRRTMGKHFSSSINASPFLFYFIYFTSSLSSAHTPSTTSSHLLSIYHPLYSLRKQQGFHGLQQNMAYQAAIRPWTPALFRLAKAIHSAQGICSLEPANAPGAAPALTARSHTNKPQCFSYKGE